MTHYQGTCHCGAVTFSIKAGEITDGMRCDCSICRRKGAVLSSFTLPPEHIEIDADKDALAIYKFGTQTATHYFCRICGIFTFVETRLIPGHFRVNLGCIDGIDIFALSAPVFDGKSI